MKNYIHRINPKSESYGEAIRTFRSYARMTQTEFAEAIGSTLSAVSLWENYKTRPKKCSFQKINAFLRKWHQENPDKSETDIINIF